MKYFLLEPEVAGELGAGTVLDSTVHPPRISRLNYELSGWVGDAILESFPCFIVAADLAGALTAGSLTGFALDEVEVTKSQEFDSMYPSRELPKFFWLQIVGLASKDDFGLAPDHRLVVSEKALEQLSRFGLNSALVEAFDAP